MGLLSTHATGSPTMLSAYVSSNSHNDTISAGANGSFRRDSLDGRLRPGAAQA